MDDSGLDAISRLRFSAAAVQVPALNDITGATWQRLYGRHLPSFWYNGRKRLMQPSVFMSAAETRNQCVESEYLHSSTGHKHRTDKVSE